MPFNIRMGLPEMDAVWTDLSTRSQAGKLDKDEQKSFTTPSLGAILSCCNPIWSYTDTRMYGV